MQKSHANPKGKQMTHSRTPAKVKLFSTTPTFFELQRCGDSVCRVSFVRNPFLLLLKDTYVAIGADFIPRNITNIACVIECFPFRICRAIDNAVWLVDLHGPCETSKLQLIGLCNWQLVDDARRIACKLVKQRLINSCSIVLRLPSGSADSLMGPY